MKETECLVSAATSCLLYVREHSRPGSVKPNSINNLIHRWISSAERRNLYSRHCLRKIRSDLKHAKKNNVADLMSILSLLVEGNGTIPDVTVSDLASVQNIRQSLLERGWWVKFGTSQEWGRIELHRNPVCFALLADAERCFAHDGRQNEALPLYITGDPDVLREVLNTFQFRLQVGSSEIVEGITVWRCYIHAGEENDDRNSTRST